MKISKRVREEAALVCSIVASDWDAGLWADDVADHLGFGEKSAALAEEAWSFVVLTYGGASGNPDAEAESMLRTGWEPS